MKDKMSGMIRLVSAMLIWGTIGIFVHYIPLPSGFIAFVRGAVGTAFLLAFCLIARKKLSWQAIKSNLVLLTISGGLIGVNWILLFESYRYTTVAAATLSYYMAPVFVVVASPFVIKERVTLKRGICAAAAFIGMIPVSGVLQTGLSGLEGILLALGAALIYAAVIFINKFLKNIGSFERTVMQLASSAAVILPYALLTTDFSAVEFSPSVIILLAVVGIVHTGLAYTLYFGALGRLDAQTSAIFSYIDPISAVILSAVILGERLSAAGILGAVLVLGSAILSELPLFEKGKEKI
ncbi:MAG: DMT family transporter [Oscillospiraceae bacterium]